MPYTQEYYQKNRDGYLASQKKYYAKLKDVRPSKIDKQFDSEEKQYIYRLVKLIVKNGKLNNLDKEIIKTRVDKLIAKNNGVFTEEDIVKLNTLIDKIQEQEVDKSIITNNVMNYVRAIIKKHNSETKELICKRIENYISKKNIPNDILEKVNNLISEKFPDA